MVINRWMQHFCCRTVGHAQYAAAGKDVPRDGTLASSDRVRESIEIPRRKLTTTSEKTT